MAYDAIVDSSELDSLLTNVANALREKTNTTDKILLTEMPSVIESITVSTPGVDDPSILPAVVERSITTFDASVVELFGDYAFAGASGLTTVVNVDGISDYGAYCFYKCTNLRSLGNSETPTISGGLVEIHICRSIGPYCRIYKSIRMLRSSIFPLCKT